MSNLLAISFMVVLHIWGGYFGFFLIYAGNLIWLRKPNHTNYQDISKLKIKTINYMKRHTMNIPKLDIITN